MMHASALVTTEPAPAERKWVLVAHLAVSHGPTGTRPAVASPRAEGAMNNPGQVCSERFSAFRGHALPAVGQNG